MEVSQILSSFPGVEEANVYGVQAALDRPIRCFVDPFVVFFLCLFRFFLSSDFFLL